MLSRSCANLDMSASWRSADFSDNGLTASRQGTKDRADGFVEVIGEDGGGADAFGGAGAGEEIGALHLAAHRFRRSLQVAAILLKQFGRFGRFFRDDPVCLALEITLAHLSFHFGQFRPDGAGECR